MNMKKLVFFVVVLIGTMCGNVVQVYSQSTSSRLEKGTPLMKVLKEIGEKYDYYFTLESALIKGNRIDSLEGQIIRKVPKMISALDGLVQLKRIIPHFSYEVDIKNPKIVFVYDAQLLGLKGYVLKERVDNLSFDGPSTDLIQELNRKGLSITAYGPSVSNEIVRVDLPTPFHISKASGQVRNLVTDPIDLKHAHRVLWFARTDLDTKRKTYFRYN